MSVLDELQLCYDSLVREQNASGEGSEALVQLLVSFISQPSALLRKLSQLVFEAFIGDITQTGLAILTDVLASEESLRGQQEQFEQVDDDQMDEDGASEDDEDELDSDVEVVKMNSLPAGMGNLKPHLDGSGDEEDEEEDDSDEEVEDNESTAEVSLSTHSVASFCMRQ